MERLTPIQAIRGAVARGWCHKPNHSKEMDVDLAEAISQEIYKMITGSYQEDYPYQ